MKTRLTLKFATALLSFSTLNPQLPTCFAQSYSINWSTIDGGGGTSTGGVWTENSDRSSKENFMPVNPREILERVTALPVQQWNYKAEGPDVRHIGLVAQGFYAAFHTGADDAHLAALDSAGVALAAIQGLNQKLEARSQKLEGENAALKARLEKLEHLLTQQLDPNTP